MYAFGKIDEKTSMLNITFNTNGITSIITLDLEDAEAFFKKMLQDIYKYKIDELNYEQ